MQSAHSAEVRLLHEYVGNGKLMQLATRAEDGSPWVVHAWYAPTPHLELIFSSNVARVHSGHIKDSAFVAGGIIAIELHGLGQEVRGVTFTGSAHECREDELETAYITYASRWPKAHELFPLAQIRSGESPMRMYIVSPKQYILFDEKNYRGQPRRLVDEW